MSTAAAAVRQAIDLARAAAEAGLDGAGVRVHHFENSLSAPFLLLPARAALTQTMEVGSGVIDMR